MNGVKLKQHVAMAIAAAACAVAATAIPASAATWGAPTAAAGTATIPRGLLPMAASWTTTQHGIVLAYPAQTTGAKPYLLSTGNGGKTWQSLPAPPVRYPSDNDQPNTVWADGFIAVTDGTHIVATHDYGKEWRTESLTGAAKSSYVDKVVIANGRLFALVTTDTTATVYSGAPQAGALRPVKGLTISGSEAYGDITTVGALQVDLGSNYSTQKYWYSKNGASFTAAPLPCPATTVAWLGGVRSGKVVALCSDTPSAIGPGETDAQLSLAAHLGEQFSASGPAFDLPNEAAFAAATPQAATVATEGNLMVTANAGKTWKAELPQANGAFWSDLSFPSATTGYVVCSTVNNSLKVVNTVYRTTNSGKTWSGLSLP